MWCLSVSCDFTEASVSSPAVDLKFEFFLLLLLPKQLLHVLNHQTGSTQTPAADLRWRRRRRWWNRRWLRHSEERRNTQPVLVSCEQLIKAAFWRKFKKRKNEVEETTYLLRNNDPHGGTSLEANRGYGSTQGAVSFWFIFFFSICHFKVDNLYTMTKHFPEMFQ